MTPQRGYSIDIFFPDGTPDGLWVVDKPNWIGKAFSCPRALLNVRKSLPEFSQPGVYLLVGPTDDVVRKLYVGEGDPVVPRLNDHLVNKDFWTKMVLFTTKDNSLNKAHIQYLESRLIQVAKRNKIVALQNGNTPQLPNLSSAECARMDAFLDEILLVAPILGIEAFETPSLGGTGLELQIKGRDVHASGRYTSQGTLVLKGSEAVKKVVQCTPSGPRELRKHLVAQKVLTLKGDRYVFSQDYLFKAPSTAATVILGRPTNGRLKWKDRDGKTLIELQTASQGTT